MQQACAAYVAANPFNTITRLNKYNAGLQKVKFKDLPQAFATAAAYSGIYRKH